MSTGAAQPEQPSASPFEESRAAIPTDPLQPAELLPAEPALPAGTTREVEATVSDLEYEAERDAVEPPLRTKEELAYYRVWREHLQGISAERTLSRFARA